MKIRVFVDTNVFIFAFEFPASNSRVIVDLLNEDKIEVIISELVVKEVYRYFRRFHSKELADDYRRYLFETCTIVFSEEVENKLNKYRGLIKEKDLEQLVVVKEFGIKYLIAYDRHFEGIGEYRTPREFVLAMELEAFGSEH